MIPPDTSMPAYDPPLSAWPGIIMLALGLIILTYLIVGVVRDYRRALLHAAQAREIDTKKTADAKDAPDDPVL